MNWMNNFDERQRKQIEWSVLYAKDFAHGDDGHNAKLIIARMATLLNEVQAALLSDNFDAEIAPLARQVLGIENDH